MIPAAVSSFLDDPSPDVRGAGVRLLAAEPSDCAETMQRLTAAMWDPAETVWRAACEALRDRLPWLLLEPFPVRAVPESVARTPLGQSWKLLRRSLRVDLRNRTIHPVSEAARRWRELPGGLPDLLDELRALGRTRVAAELETAVKSCDDGVARQVLIAPTYGCNLACSYCYARNWDSHYGGEMSLEDLELALAWCCRNGVERLLLTGGEPTVYSHILHLLARARDLGMRVWLTTNTLYSPQVREHVHPGLVRLMVSHYDQEYLSDTSRRHGLYLENLEAACASGTEVLLRYTLTEGSGPPEWSPLLDLAEAHGIEILSFAYAFRNIRGDNQFVRYPVDRPGGEFELQFLRFVDACRSRGIRPMLSKPLPLCALSEATQRELLLSGVLRAACTIHSQKCSQNLTINPDLSTLPCNAIGLTGPSLTELESFAAAGEHYAPLIDQLASRPYHEACNNCFHYYRGLCQAVCLAERTDTGIHLGEEH